MRGQTIIIFGLFLILFSVCASLVPRSESGSGVDTSGVVQYGELVEYTQHIPEATPSGDYVISDDELAEAVMESIYSSSDDGKCTQAVACAVTVPWSTAGWISVEEQSGPKLMDGAYESDLTVCVADAWLQVGVRTWDGERWSGPLEFLYGPDTCRVEYWIPFPDPPPEIFDRRRD